MEINNFNDLSSSDIEEMIQKPVSFPLNDDFFTESSSVKNNHPHLYEDIPPLVNPDRYTADTSFKKGSSRRKEEHRTEKKSKYSMLPEFNGKFKYEYAPEEQSTSSFKVRNDIPESAPAPQKPKIADSPRKDITVDIFGEKRESDDILFTYDLNRLFDIQKEISFLISAIQQLRSSQHTFSEREEELKERVRKVMEENEKKKDVIDRLIEDVTSLYEVLRMRTDLVHKQEDALLNNISVEKTSLPGTDKSAKTPLDRQEFTPAAKPKAAPEKKPSVLHPPVTLRYGLNPDNVAVINRAVSSMK